MSRRRAEAAVDVGEREGATKACGTHATRRSRAPDEGEGETQVVVNSIYGRSAVKP